MKSIVNVIFHLSKYRFHLIENPLKFAVSKLCDRGALSLRAEMVLTAWDDWAPSNGGCNKNQGNRFLRTFNDITLSLSLTFLKLNVSLSCRELISKRGCWQSPNKVLLTWTTTAKDIMLETQLLKLTFVKSLKKFL